MSSIPSERWRYVAVRLLKDAVLRIPGLPGLDSRRHACNTGSMYDPEEAAGLLSGHLERLARHGGEIDRLRALEIGPGNSLAQAFLLLLLGAERVTAVDVRRYATESTGRDVYAQIIDEINGWLKSGRFHSAADRLERKTRGDRLLPAGARFPRTGEELRYEITDGTGLPLPDDSCNFSYSVSVLEHVEDPAETYRELARVLEPGALMSHIIDLRDHHHPEPLDFLRYGDRLWSRMQGRSAGFTNRLRASDHFGLMEASGFELLDVRRTNAESPPRPVDLAPRFRVYDETDLKTLTLIVTCRLQR